MDFYSSAWRRCSQNEVDSHHEATGSLEDIRMPVIPNQTVRLLQDDTFFLEQRRHAVLWTSTFTAARPGALLACTHAGWQKAVRLAILCIESYTFNA